MRDQRLLGRRESLLERHHDEVVSHIGLGLDRTTPVILALQTTDPVGNRHPDFAFSHRSILSHRRAEAKGIMRRFQE
jgi:hypothetical protein